MKRVSKLKGSCLALLVVFLTIVLFAPAFLSAYASSQPEIYLTDVDKGRILKPYLALFSFKPLIISLDDPRGIACGPDGLLYVAETCEHRIIRFDQHGDYEEKVVVEKPSSNFKGQPLNLTFGPNGNLFFTTPKKGLWMLEYGDPRNQPECLIKGSYFDQDESLHDLAFLKAGEHTGDLIVSVLTTKPYKGYVLRVPAPDYNQVRSFVSEYSVEEMGNKIQNHLRVPVALAVNSIGEVFVADHEKRENHVLRYAPNGEFVDIFVESAVNPLDLRFDANDKLYVTLGPLLCGDSEAGGMKVYDRSGDQEMFIPRRNLWGVALCED